MPRNQKFTRSMDVMQIRKSTGEIKAIEWSLNWHLEIKNPKGSEDDDYVKSGREQILRHKAFIAISTERLKLTHA